MKSKGRQSCASSTSTALAQDSSAGVLTNAPVNMIYEGTISNFVHCRSINPTHRNQEMEPSPLNRGMLGLQAISWARPSHHPHRNRPLEGALVTAVPYKYCISHSASQHSFERYCICRLQGLSCSLKWLTRQEELLRHSAASYSIRKYCLLLLDEKASPIGVLWAVDQ